MLKLRLQLFWWRSLGRLAIWLRDSGQRCFTWYEQHSPMKIVTASQWSVTPDTTCPICGKSNCYYWKGEMTL
jgi:hypothetical protein